MSMNGVVKNVSKGWAHAFKRAVSPGEEIPLDDLYAAYGEKHGLAEGEEFIRWIKDVKLPNRDKWKVITEPEKVEEVVVDEKAKDIVKPVVPKDMNVMDIVELSVRNAREALPKINDGKLLKYALKEASQRPNKESLCKIIRKRINELSLHAKI